MGSQRAGHELATYTFHFSIRAQFSPEISPLPGIHCPEPPSHFMGTSGEISPSPMASINKGLLMIPRSNLCPDTSSEILACHSLQDYMDVPQVPPMQPF